MTDFLEYLKDRLPTGPVDALGKYYGGVFDVLQMPRRAALAPLGGQEAVDTGFEKSVDEYTQRYNDPAGGTLFMPDTKGGWQLRDPIRYGLARSGATDFAFKTATDPLTYLGALPAKVANPVQSIINTALLAPAKLPMAGINRLPLGPLGDKLRLVSSDPATDALQSTPAKTLGEYLWGGPSRRSQLHLYSQDLQDMSERLMTRGHDLELDIADMATAQSGSFIRPWDAQNPATNNQAARNMLTNYTSRAAQIGGAHQVEMGALSGALREAGRDIMATSQGPQAQYEGMMKMFRAADDIMNHVESGKISGVDDVWDAFSRRRSAVDFLAQGRAGILGDLPEEMRPRGEAAWGAISTHGRQLANDRETIETGLRELWDLENARRGGSLGAYNPIAGIRSGSDAEVQINQRLQQMGLGSIAGTTEDPFSSQFHRLLSGRIGDTTTNKIGDVLGRWGGAGDPLTENGWKLVFDATARDRSKLLGMAPEDQNAFLRWLDSANTLWKSSVLQSPNYLLTNYLSGTASSGMAGVDIRNIAGNMLRGGFKALKGETVEIPEIAAQNARLGLSSPAGASGSTGFLTDQSTLRDLSGKGLDVLSRVGPLRMGAGGAAVGAAAGYQRAQETPEDDTLYQTALGTGTGALTFGTMPWLSRNLYQPLAQGTEQVLRQSAVVTGRERFLERNLDRGLQLIDSVLGGQTPPAVRSAVEQAGGAVSSRELDEILRANSVPPSIRQGLRGEWDSFLKEADDAGLGLANEINFDYRNLTNSEEFARQVLPFSTWGIKALPFFAQRIAENPVIGSTLGRYYDESERDRKEKGLTGRFAGSVEGPPELSSLWSTLTGRPSEAYFNPIRQFMPASDAVRASSFPANDDASMYESIKQALQMVGLSEHPVMGMLARMGGYAEDEPVQGLLRQGSPVQALTGIDLNAPQRAVETGIRRGLGQGEVRDPEVQSALRRIDELAYERTGQVIGSEEPGTSPYVRAKVERRGPIWEQALAETRRERGARSVGNFLFAGGTPTATLGETERGFSEARAGIVVSPELSRELTVRVQRSPHSPASPEAVEQVRAASGVLLSRTRPELGGALPPEIEQVLENPTWKDLDRLRDLMMDAQVEDDPRVRGYSGSGSAEKQRLQHALSLYQNTGAVVAGDEAFARLKPETQERFLNMLENFDRYPADMQRRILRTDVVVQRLLPKIRAQKALILKQNPDLQEYLTYREDAGPEANMDAFLQLRHSR